MWKKIILIALIGSLCIMTIFFMLKKQKRNIPCDQLETSFSSYPLNFEELSSKADSCGSVSNRFHWNEKLFLSSDGVSVSIAKLDEKKQDAVSNRKDQEGSLDSTQYHGIPIEIWYRAHQQTDNIDIQAKFRLEVDGFIIKGDIRGLYSEVEHEQSQEIPEKAFEQTQERIFAFLDTYLEIAP